MLGTLCTLITALTCKEADWLQLSPHVGFISLCVSLDSMSSCCFQVWVVRRWWHRSLLLWRWGEERQPPWTVTWGLLLIVLLAGINRFLEEFISLCCFFIIPTALQPTVLVSPLQSSHLLISHNQIIVWSSTMLSRETLQSITVRHMTRLPQSGYHSDLHCGKNLLTEYLLIFIVWEWSHQIMFSVALPLLHLKPFNWFVGLSIKHPKLPAVVTLRKSYMWM